MQYLTVRASDDLNHDLLEVDVLLSDLIPLLNGIEGNLRIQGVFDQEKVVKRLVPRLFITPGISARLIDKPPTDLGEDECSIYYAQLPGNQPGDLSGPIESLSLWFYAPATGRLCSVDVPINHLLRSAQERLRRELTEIRRIRSDDLIHFDTFLHGQGIVRPAAERERVSLLLLVQPQLSDGNSLDQQDANRSPVDVKITHRQSLVTPFKRSWHAYGVRLMGELRPGDLRILMSQDVYDALNRVARSSLRQDAETGGFLVGYVCEDEQGEPFVDISNTVLADGKASSFRRLRYDQEVWRQAFDELARRFPGKHRIGWYHTHLTGARRLQPVVSLRSGDQTLYEIEVPLFSNDDATLHRSFFSEPWQIALVIDLKRSEITFYQWEDDKLVPCHAFYLYDPTTLSGEQA